MQMGEVLRVSMEPIADAVRRFDNDLLEAKEKARSAQIQAECTAGTDGEISQEEEIWEADVFNRFANLRRFKQRSQVPVRYYIVAFGIKTSFEVGRSRGHR
jgi:hypothetical protein